MRDLLDAVLPRLSEEGIKVLVEGVLVGGLTLVAALLARSLTKSGKVWIGAGAGRTRISPFVMLLSMLCAAMALVALAAGLWWREALRDPGEFYAWVGLVGGFSLGALAMLPLTRHTWEWDPTGLRWHGAWRSVSMHWSDIVRFSKAISGTLYVTDTAGRKISWSPQYTLEHEALRLAIQSARPDLALDLDWGAAPEPWGKPSAAHPPAASQDR